ncbi:hypothetical protein SR187_9470 [Streptococcus ruminantium]|uniref:Uncharacterized protein n=1 Tax=Streptococcus ruminantium TaxID=1917441 RepID=A0A2Z5TT46_9STRE|nr:hypothetical protein SR187_9470 [Streptococcus ruminantium]
METNPIDNRKNSNFEIDYYVMKTPINTVMPAFLRVFNFLSKKKIEENPPTWTFSSI